MPIVYKLDKTSNDLNKSDLIDASLSYPKEITISKSSVPILGIGILAIIFATGLFVVGYDQGHIFSILYGEQAFEELYIHELTHDMRHAAGFPCH